MSLDLIILVIAGVAALAVVTMFVYIRRHPDRQPTPADAARMKWLFLAVVIWTLVLRGLATEAAQSCGFSIAALGRNWFSTFLACSPKLLSGSPAEVFLFFWAWAPLPLIAAYCVHRLLRMARRPNREFKES